MHLHRHTDDVPQTLVGISFPDVFRAQEFLTASARLATQGSLKVADAIILVKDTDGRTRVQETVDPQPAQSALSGALWTGLLGLILAGPIGLIAGGAIGAGTGAVAAKVIDIGIPDEWVEWFKEAVPTGTATVALLVTDLQEGALVQEATRFTGQLIYANLSETTQARLRTALGDASGTTSGMVGDQPHDALSEPESPILAADDTSSEAVGGGAVEPPEDRNTLTP